MDMRIAYSVVTKYAFRNCTSNAAVAKSCLGTHTALQPPMAPYYSDCMHFNFYSSLACRTKWMNFTREM